MHGNLWVATLKSLCLDRSGADRLLNDIPGERRIVPLQIIIKLILITNIKSFIYPDLPSLYQHSNASTRTRWFATLFE